MLSAVIIEASVEPAPISIIAKGFAVPGVVKAPIIAISASTPPTTTFLFILFCSSIAIISICSLSAFTIAASPIAFSIENSSAIPPLTFCGTKVLTANRS